MTEIWLQEELWRFVNFKRNFSIVQNWGREQIQHKNAAFGAKWAKN